MSRGIALVDGVSRRAAGAVADEEEDADCDEGKSRWVSDPDPADVVDRAMLAIMGSSKSPARSEDGREERIIGFGCNVW